MTHSNILIFIHYDKVGNWEIEVDFTHSVVGITFGETIWDAIPTPLDADMTSYKFTSPSGGSLTGSSWEFNLLGRSYETDIAATRGKISL